MRITLCWSGILSLLVGCSTPASERAYVEKAAVPIVTGTPSTAELQQRAKTEEVLDIKHATPAKGSSLQAAQLASVVKPKYPAAAQAARKEGTVTVAIIIGADGSVRDAKLVNATDPIFIESAIEAVKQWKFHPALVDGKPVNISSSVPVVFSLK
ncbi:MAG: TonB family protein [Spartobacteria bacterium]|nr:TonB family protein [Spartobacteria bacterium]